MTAEDADISLREFIERVFEERNLRYLEMFAARDTAILKAETAQAEYNIRSNEFRGALDDQAKTMLTRAEADRIFLMHRELIDATHAQISALPGPRLRLIARRPILRRRQCFLVVAMRLTDVGLDGVEVAIDGASCLTVYARGLDVAPARTVLSFEPARTRDTTIPTGAHHFDSQSTKRAASV